MRKSYLWAGAIAVGLGVWMATPYLAGAPATEQHEASPAVEAAEKLFKVRVKTFTAIPRVAVVTANGVTAASRRVDARARTNGTIMESLFKQGQSVKEGDVLCRLDMADRESNLVQAKASLASAQRDFEATERLVKNSYATDSKLWADKARVDAAQAQVESIETDLTYLEVKSPVNGVLIEKPMEAGSLLAPGGLCATVSELDPLLVAVQISESNISYVVEGMTAKARLATGEEVDGKVSFISKTADLSTRTFKVELEIANPGELMREGVTTELSVGLPPRLAQKLPGSILILNDAGKFGVRVLNDDSTTQFQPVEVIAQEIDGMWVTGLANTVKIVTLGQDYVRDGEKVDPVVETAGVTQ
jgi:membrane fusion protein, multidrug efflux system